MNESEELAREVAAWLEKRGFAAASRVSGGRNNRIYKVTGRDGAAALKIYYRGTADRRDRFAAERACYELAAKRGVSAPRWLDSDQHLGVALLGWIEGAPLSGQIGEEDISAAADFLVRINEPFPSQSDVPYPASEACFSTDEHLQLLEGRINRLREAADGAPAFEEFLGSTLSPFFARLRGSLVADARADFRSSAGQRRILSPGDFGLHNALRDEGGRISFFDFEYSGWDDPVKTVADVFLQPEKPVDWKFLPQFCEWLHLWSGLEKRVRAWLPFFAAKWAVILLGPVAKDAAERRRFAGEETDETAMERQIVKAHDVIRRGNEFFS